MGDDDEPQVKICDKETKDGQRTGCGIAIPLVKENMKIMNPKIPLLNVICPECHLSYILDKGDSAVFADLYFRDEIAEKLKTAADAGSEKAPKTPRVNPEETGMPDDNRPSAKMASLVIATMKTLQYTGAKWDQKTKMIEEFVRTVPAYTTQQGLQSLLQTMSVDGQHIQLIVQRVFGGQEMATMQMPQIGQITTPGVSSYPQYPGFSQSGAPVVQQLPGGGSIIMMPATQPGMQQTLPDTGGEWVEEILGKDGKPAKRIYHGAARADHDVADPLAQFANMLTLMKTMGVIPEPRKPESRETEGIAQLTTIVGSLTEVVDRIAKGEHGPSDNRVLRDSEDRIKELQEEIGKLRDEDRKRENDELRQRLQALEMSRGHDTGTRIDPRDSPEMKKTQLQYDALDKTGGRFEHLAEKVIDPMIELQKMQMKMNAVLLMRDLARQDGVPPGSYIQAVETTTPAPEPPDTVVQEQVEKWKQKSAAAHTQKPPEPTEVKHL
jgi:hypothetical protein